MPKMLFRPVKPGEPRLTNDEAKTFLQMLTRKKKEMEIERPELSNESAESIHLDTGDPDLQGVENEDNPTSIAEFQAPLLTFNESVSGDLYPRRTRSRLERRTTKYVIELEELTK